MPAILTWLISWKTLAAILTLAIMSFLYKENPFYRFAEYLFVGLSAGYGFAMTYHLAMKPNLLRPFIIPLLQRIHILGGEPLPINWWYIIPTFFALCYLSVIVPKYSHIIRLPFAFLLGLGSGMAIPRSFQAAILEQLWDTILHPKGYHGYVDMSEKYGWSLTLVIVSAIIIFVSVLAVLAYFFFSKPHKGAYGKFARFGIIILMIGFGASFGSTVMARFSLLIGRLMFLLSWISGFPH